MFAKFAIRKNQKTRVFFSKTMVGLALPVFARGPGYATTIVTDLGETISADFSMSGFAIDHDHRRAFVHDDSVVWTNREATPLVARLDALRSLDLYEYEDCLAGPFASSRSPQEWFAALAELPLDDSWKDWELTWSSGNQFSKIVGEIYSARS